MLILPESSLHIKQLTVLLSGRNISTSGHLVEIEHERYSQEWRYKGRLEDGDIAMYAIAPQSYSPESYFFLEDIFNSSKRKEPNRDFIRKPIPVRLRVEGIVVYDKNSLSGLVECYARILSYIHTNNI